MTTEIGNLQPLDTGSTPKDIKEINAKFKKKENLDLRRQLHVGIAEALINNGSLGDAAEVIKIAQDLGVGMDGRDAQAVEDLLTPTPR
jgi:hypothetical protein